MNLPRRGPTLKTIAAKIQPERLMQNETYSKDILVMELPLNEIKKDIFSG